MHSTITMPIAKHPRSRLGIVPYFIVRTTRVSTMPIDHHPHPVVGRKYVRLYPASITEDLYPYEGSMLNNSSQVDLDNLNGKDFPKAQDLDFVDCILEEGEMLYIPPKWWHYVRSLTTSFSQIGKKGEYKMREDWLTARLLFFTVLLDCKFCVLTVDQMI
ncbi:hypothetical protein ACLOJK_020337 [Asimina triloba]